MLSEVLNGVTTVVQDAFFPIEEGNGTFGRARIFKSNIQGDMTGKVA